MSAWMFLFKGVRQFIPCLKCWWQEGSVEGSVLVWPTDLIVLGFPNHLFSSFWELQCYEPWFVGFEWSIHAGQFGFSRHMFKMHLDYQTSEGTCHRRSKLHWHRMHGKCIYWRTKYKYIPVPNCPMNSFPTLTGAPYHHDLYGHSLGL